MRRQVRFLIGTTALYSFASFVFDKKLVNRKPHSQVLIHGPSLAPPTLANLAPSSQERKPLNLNTGFKPDSLEKALPSFSIAPIDQFASLTNGTFQTRVPLFSTSLSIYSIPSSLLFLCGLFSPPLRRSALAFSLGLLQHSLPLSTGHSLS